MRKFITFFLSAIFIISFINVACATAEMELKEGDRVEQFVLRNGLTKKDISFNDNIMGKSKYSVIIFANTACGACRKEMQTLSKLSTKFSDLTTYVVLVDMRGEDIVEEYHKQFGYNVTYLLDPEFTIPPTYGFNFTPSMMIVDKNGIIRYKKGGYNFKKDEEVITQKVQELIVE